MIDSRLFGGFLCALTSVLAQQPKQPASLEDELQALLNTPITVASQKAMTTRESPGIVSLVTREEILASGARDLMDVLRLVPGFDFGSDVQGVAGPFVRGLWAFEGKLLLLVDGQEFNETRYGTTQFGGHIPVDQIKQVEIIRGPGSAIYGGYAELAVVNVITRQGRDLRGFSATGTLAQGDQGNTQRTLSLAYGDAKDSLEWSLAASVGRMMRSEDAWTSFNGTRELKDLSKLNQGFFNFGLKYKDFQARVIHDRYEITDWTFFRDYSPTPMRFHGTYVEAKQTFALSDTFQIVPKVSYKSQLPWYYPEDPDQRKKETRRTTAGIQALWDPSKTVNLVAGFDTWRDEGRTTTNLLWSNQETTITYSNYAAYLQALWMMPVGNLTLGARYDHNSQFGSSFVPRFAFTKVWGGTHMKLLASKAFRAPSIENFELAKNVRPEKTTALELEVGTPASHLVV